MKTLPRYTKVLTLGASGTERALMGEVVCQEKVDGCVDINARILKADLSYVKASELNIGDELVGFDENCNRQKLRKSTVTMAKPIMKKCVLISTNKRELIVSKDHPFLIDKKLSDGLTKHYKVANEIKIGDRIVSIGTWDYEKSWVSGYIAGQFDGEGSLVKGNTGYTRALSYYQQAGRVEVDFIIRELQKRGFQLRISEYRRNGKHKKIISIFLGGEWVNILRFLGMFNPKRLIADSEKIWVGAGLNFIENEEVKDIRQLGQRKVMGLSTSTKTYIAEGLFSHNSQFRFGINEYGDVIAGSKSVNWEGNVDSMFELGYNYVMSIEKELKQCYKPDTYFFCEYLQKHKHNVLVYDRVPENHLVLFDALIDGKWTDDRNNLLALGATLGIDVVPELYRGTIEMQRVGAGEKFDRTKGWTGLDFLKNMINQNMSFLGGVQIEGVVMKNYHEFMPIGGQVFPVFTKYVREEYKEKHDHQWKAQSPKASLLEYFQGFANENRWKKAIQHLKERDELTNSPKDIGALVKEIQRDVMEEEVENIKNYLYNHFKKDIMRTCIRKFPEWYKDLLVEENIKGE